LNHLRPLNAPRPLGEYFVERSRVALAPHTRPGGIAEIWRVTV
jgi:hypothetical protein